MKNSTTKSYDKLMPNIAENIEKTLKQLNIVPEETPRDFIERTQGIKHRYSSVCMYQGEKTIFYAGLHKDRYEKNRMRTETEIAKKLMDNPVFSYFPRYLAAETGDFDWLIREWFPSLPIEHKTRIEKLKRDLTKEEIKEIAKATLDMNMLDTSLFPLNTFKIEKYFKANAKGLDLTDEEKANLKSLIDKDLLQKEHKYFTHGDFQIGNILVFERIKIIDLESAELNNFAWDIAFLTTRMWQDKNVRTGLINEYYNLLDEEKKQAFACLFRLDCFIIANQSYYSEPTEYTKEELAKRKGYYARFLKACCTSFESLVNHA